MKQYLLNDVPEDLWEALRADAASRETPETFSSGTAGRTYPHRRTERTGTSLNNVVAEVLASRYALKFEPTNRATFSQTPINRSLFLRLPDDMMAAVKAEAVELGPIRTVIVAALAEHYLLEVPLKLRVRKVVKKHGRPRGRKAKA
jgi:hypothetical protein